MTNQQGKVDDFYGEISAAQLLAEYPSFLAQYESYEPSDEEVAAVASLEGKTLLVLFGTWCHDSQREVPRLLKTLAASGRDTSDVTLIAVDRSKKDPDGIAVAHALKYTPTIILLDGDKEVGRVVERPQQTLLQDLQLLVEKSH
jgi:thiol-disulfide isomerase/thioredoxin